MTLKEDFLTPSFLLHVLAGNPPKEEHLIPQRASSVGFTNSFLLSRSQTTNIIHFDFQSSKFGSWVSLQLGPLSIWRVARAHILRIFWYNMFRLLSCFRPCQSRSQLFFPFSEGWYLETNLWVQDMLGAGGGSCRRQTCTHLSVSVCIFILKCGLTLTPAVLVQHHRALLGSPTDSSGFTHFSVLQSTKSGFGIAASHP